MCCSGPTTCWVVDRLLNPKVSPWNLRTSVPGLDSPFAPGPVLTFAPDPVGRLAPTSATVSKPDVAAPTISAALGGKASLPRLCSLEAEPVVLGRPSGAWGSWSLTIPWLPTPLGKPQPSAIARFIGDPPCSSCPRAPPESTPPYVGTPSARPPSPKPLRVVGLITCRTSRSGFMSLEVFREWNGRHGGPSQAN